MTPTLLTTLNFGLEAAMCVAAFVRGDSSLRLAAGASAVAAIASEAFQDWNGAHKAQPYIFAVDIAFTALLYAILVRTQTRWPKYAFVASVLIVVTHVMANFDRGLTRWAFFSAYYVFSYMLLATLALAAIFEARATA